MFTLSIVTLPNSVKAQENIDVEEFGEYETNIIYVDSEISDEELLQEMERIENERVQAQAKKTKSNVGYTVKLEYYIAEVKSTGWVVAGNQTTGGTNFGSQGGAFGYTEGNGYSVKSISFGVSGYGISASLGVGTKQSAGVGGYTVNAPANKYVKLYVNKSFKAVTYKRYKVYNINGYKEAYGHTTSWPTHYSTALKVL